MISAQAAAAQGNGDGQGTPEPPFTPPADLLIECAEELRGRPARYYWSHRVLFVPPGVSEPELAVHLTYLFGTAGPALMPRVSQACADARHDQSADR
jgi:hypothetical protein